jgi:hypothetical protein
MPRKGICFSQTREGGYTKVTELRLFVLWPRGVRRLADGKPGALHRLIYAGLATLTVALVLLSVNLIRHRG